MYNDKNLLSYVKTSKLGASKISWLSDLAFFNFNTQYHMGKTNKATNTLSQYPINQELEQKGNSDNVSKDLAVLSYVTI